jgi:plastocyanin
MLVLTVHPTLLDYGMSIYKEGAYMNKGVKVIIALAVVGVIAAVALFLTKDSSKGTTDDTSNGNAAASVTITYSDGSFTPSEVTVQSGGTVKIINESDSEVEPASDDHPVHTDNAEINFGEIAAGESKTVTVNATGTWGYHNHLSSSETGTIVVE